MKTEYKQYLDPLIIKDVQHVQLKQLGSANIRDLRIYGLEQLEADMDSLSLLSHYDSSVMKFNLKLTVSNLTAQFKVDANLQDKLYVNDWSLSLEIENCAFSSTLMFDFASRSLMIASYYIKSMDHFRIRTHSLTWPFNEIVTSIIQKEKSYLKNVIEMNVQKYINLTLNNRFNLNLIFKEILDKQASPEPYSNDVQPTNE